MKSVTSLLIAILCISCDRPDGEGHHRNNTPLPATGPQQSTSEEENGKRKNALQRQAESFFKAFSIALSESKAETAAAMIGQEHRERFLLGYRLWQGTQFLDPIVKRASEDGTLIEVEVSFKHEQNGGDRETKSLRFADGKWQLLDS